MPYRLIDAEEQEIEGGNADLRPTRSWNVDGRLDWQPAPGSSVGVGFFYRELTDFTFSCVVVAQAYRFIGVTFDGEFVETRFTIAP